MEVTVHRNSNSLKKPSKKTTSKTWADSLSDTDVQFDKPTKSSLAKRSPRKENTKTRWPRRIEIFSRCLESSETC